MAVATRKRSGIGPCRPRTHVTNKTLLNAWQLTARLLRFPHPTPLSLHFAVHAAPVAVATRTRCA